MLAWASITDTEALTGVTVSGSDLAKATARVEAVAFARVPIPSAVTDLSDDDRERMRRAVAFEASAQVAGTGERPVGASKVSVGDVSVTYDSGTSETAGLDATSWGYVKTLSFLRVGPRGGFNYPPEHGSIFLGESKDAFTGLS